MISGVEIRLFNHKNDEAFYKMLTDEELEKIQNVLNIDIQRDTERVNQLKCSCCKRWFDKDRVFKNKDGINHLCFGCY